MYTLIHQLNEEVTLSNLLDPRILELSQKADKEVVQAMRVSIDIKRRNVN